MALTKFMIDCLIDCLTSPQPLTSGHTHMVTASMHKQRCIQYPLPWGIYGSSGRGEGVVSGWWGVVRNCRLFTQSGAIFLEKSKTGEENSLYPVCMQHCRCDSANEIGQLDLLFYSFCTVIIEITHAQVTI